MLKKSQLVDDTCASSYSATHGITTFRTVQRQTYHAQDDAHACWTAPLSIMNGERE